MTPAGGPGVRPGPGGPRVDVHAHLMPRSLFDRLPVGLDLVEDEDAGRALRVAARGGKVGRPAVPILQDHGAHRAAQRGHGIDVTLIGPWIDMIVAPVEAETQVAFCDVVNAALADAVAGSDDRFLAALPDLDGGAAAEVLARACDLGAAGAMLSSNPGHGTLARSDLDRLWATAEELAVPVVLHPGAFEPPERMREFFLVNLVGNPFETTLAVGSLLGAEVPDRFPDLKLVLAHGGGFFPYQSGRMSAGFARWPSFSQRTSPLPSDYLGWFYYDSVLFDRSALTFLLDLVGDGRVLAGSDCPFTMSDHSPFDAPGTLGLDEVGTARILGWNAVEIFGLEVEGSPTNSSASSS